MNSEVQSAPNRHAVDRYAPLSPWAYIGYMLLFYLPIVGLVFMIIYSADDTNISRRNYARAFLGLCIATLVLGVIFGAIGLGTGMFDSFMARFGM